MTLTRRSVLGAAACLTAPAAAARRALPVAGVTTVYHHNSHADVILSRLLQTETLDHRGRRPDLELVSLYVDQVHRGDMSRDLARSHGFRLCRSIDEALTLGGSDLAVKGVLLVGEHGSYGHSPQGHELYPRKRFWDETVALFRRTGRSVPVFMDKHLSHTWKDAKEIYDEARRMDFPLMAGSSLPGTWRRPAVEVRRSSPLREIVALSYHTLYGYGFHALEMVQCLAERRRGGETGVRSVQCLEGPAVWEAMRAGRWSRVLQDAAASRLTRPMPADLEKTVPTPTAFLIDYRDGLRATVLTLNGAVGEWSVAWQEQGKAAPESTLFWTQEARPFGHFSFLLRGIEEMIHRGRPSWPVERTLLTTGVLDALLESRFRGGRPLETPWLRLDYPATPGWTDPGPPPPSRPVNSY